MCNKLQGVLVASIGSFVSSASIVGGLELSFEEGDQTLEVSNDLDEFSLSVGDGTETAGVLFNSGFVISNKGGEGSNLDVEFFNGGLMSNNVGGFLGSKFLKQLVDEGDDLSELVLVDFRRGGSEFSQDADDGCDEGRRLVGEVLLEEGNNVAESGLGLDERSGVRVKGSKEAEGLFASGDSVGVVLDGLVVSSVLVFKSLFSGGLVVGVGSEVSGFVIEGVLLVDFLFSEISIFLLIVLEIVVGGFELSGETGNFFTAPSTLTLDGSFVRRGLFVEGDGDGRKNFVDSVQSAGVLAGHVNLDERSQSHTERFFLQLIFFTKIHRF